MLIVLLHGGFWRASYDRSHTGPMAAALAAENFVVCALEYRRTGPPGVAGRGVAGRRVAGRGGWPGRGVAGRGTFDDVAADMDALPDLVRGVVALAPVSDLAACDGDGLGGNAAGALLGGGPGEWPERYAVTDPAGLVPLGVPVRIVHGSDDAPVPCAMSREFARRAGAAGAGRPGMNAPWRGPRRVLPQPGLRASTRPSSAAAILPRH